MGLTYKSAIEKLLAQPALACSWLFMLKFEFWQLWRRVIKLIAELHNSALDTLSQSGHLLLIQFENRSLVFQSLVDNFPGKVGFFFLFCRMGVVSQKGTEDRKKVGGANFQREKVLNDGQPLLSFEDLVSYACWQSFWSLYEADKISN